MDLPGSGVLLRFVQRVGLRVRYLDGPSLLRGASDQGPGARRNAHVPLDPLIFERLVVSCGPTVFAVLVAIEAGMIGAAQPRGRIHDSLQDRIQVKSRTADNLQHFADRCLISEQFLQVARAVAQFVEQPRVLHRDDRLCGERADQFDLALGKRLDLLSCECQDADRFAFAQQWNAERCALLPQRD